MPSCDNANKNCSAVSSMYALQQPLTLDRDLEGKEFC
ncbi:hypothetical protein CW304_23220 [Bacillus sp. UFRGS-B20]|nr:hypothetical protein CW304_23220 [Bacillus sp. UFRGS-B20]